MTPTASQQFRALAAEAVLDAVRRRVVAVIAVISLLALWLAQSCTGVDSWTVTQSGGAVDTAKLLGATGAILFGTLTLWTVTLAGLLASDHLTQALGDGSASLALSRPVARSTFVLARLAGALAVALGAGAVLLVPTALSLRGKGLAATPALEAAGACVLGSVAVGAAGMAVSLWLPRLASFLLVFLAVGTITSVNLASTFGSELSGAAGALDRYGPPLARAVFAPLRPWYGQAPADGAWLALRLLLWALGTMGLLVWVFRREEI